MYSGRNYGRSSVMTGQISNFTEQSFPNNLFSSSVVSDVEVYKADTSVAMEKVCKFVYFNLHFNLNRFFLHGYLLLMAKYVADRSWNKITHWLT